MYTSHIGQRFVALYNKKRNTQYTAKTFFNEILYPIFLDDEKLLVYVTNSPFVQQIGDKQSWLSMSSVVRRKLQKDEFDRKIAEEEIDGSFCVGFQAKDSKSGGELNTTTGQLTSLNIHWENDDKYSSWIGACLGIGVGGGQSILIDNEDILWAIYEGWSVYRSFVQQTEGIDNKIDTWNGVWLNYRLSDSYNPEHPEDFFPVQIDTDGKAKMERPSWVQLLFSLSFTLNVERLPIYVYQFSQMNTTYGFIQVYLTPVKRVFHLYSILFPNDGIRPTKFAELYKTEWGFAHVCRSGTIGLKQIEPKDLRKYFSGAEKTPSTKEYEKSQFNFQMYYTWIIAMLNNKEFLDLAEQTARALHTYVAGGQRSKNTRSNEVDAVVNAKSRKSFADALSKLVEEDNSIAKELNNALNAVQLDIAPDNLLYFISLVKFKYALPEALLSTHN